MLAQTVSTRPLPVRPPPGPVGQPRGAQVVAIVSSVKVLRGRDAILAVQPDLAALASRCGQRGEMDRLAHLLTTPDALSKTPYLLLIGQPHSRPQAAVLVFEYRTALCGTRVFCTADATGRRAVIAPRTMRAQIAACAARTLMRRGAQVVHIAYSRTHFGQESPDDDASRTHGSDESMILTELRRDNNTRSAQWTLLEREIPVYLPLFATFDKTLARIGQRTRSNLRYYRRRAEHDLGSHFVADAQITEGEFLAFNRDCMYAVSDELALGRLRALRGPAQGTLQGVKDDRGRWLSLVGLQRQNSFIEIDWQMNRAGLPRYSLCTVMRSYLISDEIARDSTRLYINGGTPQPLALSFTKESIGELTVKNTSLYPRLLERFSARLFPPKNYLAQTFRNTDLRWRSLR